MVKIWAHRGASAQAPENTLLSFAKAIEQRADGIELDVQLTRDGIPVICHDFEIDRVSDGKGLIKDYTLNELRQWNFNRRHPEMGFLPIPTLAEVFDLIKWTDLELNVEIKSGQVIYPGIEEKILALEKDFSLEGRIWYSSFNHLSVMKIRQLDPASRCGVLFDCVLVDPWVYAARLGVAAIHPYHSILAYPGLVKACKESGIAIHAWTIDKPEDLRRAFGLDIEAVITNRPDLAREILENGN